MWAFLWAGVLYDTTGVVCTTKVGTSEEHWAIRGHVEEMRHYFFKASFLVLLGIAFESQSTGSRFVRMGHLAARPATNTSGFGSVPLTYTYVRWR